MLTSAFVLVVAFLLIWVAFKVIGFIASGCLKLVVFAVLAGVILGMLYYQFR
jgi:hypothetical protein